VDYSAAQYQQINTSGSVSLNFTNWPTAGTAGAVVVAVTVTSTAHTLTLPVAVSLGTTGLQGYASNVITFAATGTYQFEFSTVDAGTTITVYDLNRPLLGSTESAIGYSTGTGGTVAQATNKSTGVTLNKRCGQITMQNTNLAAATIVNFVLTNSTIGANDLLLLQHQSGGTLGSYTLNAACAAGSATIYVRNNTAGTLGEALVIRYAVINGSVT
jgi:hypothetical protein